MKKKRKKELDSFCLHSAQRIGGGGETISPRGVQLFIVQPLIISVCPRQAQSLKTVIYYAVHSFPFQFIALYTQWLRLRCLSLFHLGARPLHSVTCSISLPSSQRLLKAIKSRRNVFLLCFPHVLTAGPFPCTGRPRRPAAPQAPHA